MTYHGLIKNGQIAWDTPGRLPEGAAVKVEVLESSVDGQSSQIGDSLSSLLLRHAGKGRDLPSDLAAHHDHYAHGKPVSINSGG